MSPVSISMLYYYRKEKVLTMVSAFFDATNPNSVRFQQESLSVLHKKIKSGKGSIYSELCLSVLYQKMKSKNFKGLSEKSGPCKIQ